MPVVAWLLKELFAPLGLTKLRTVHDVVLGASPGADQTLQGYLRWLPLRPVRNKEAEAPECQLGKKLINFVSVKGEDLLLQAPSVGTMKFHRCGLPYPANCGGGEWYQMRATFKAVFRTVNMLVKGIQMCGTPSLGILVRAYRTAYSKACEFYLC